MKKIQIAILQTLAYADIFDYPLKKEEIYQFLLSDIEYGELDISKVLKKIPQISQKDNFLFLKDRKEIVTFRKKRERWSQRKLKIAQRVVRYLKLVPWVKMVAITGNLAMNNSNEDDDIDLLIVSNKKRLWLTRFLAVFLVELVANRRRPDDKEIKDKICLNMFLDEAHLQIPTKEQNLVTAHEVCQLKPLFSKDNFYQKFIQQNQWSQKFLPNWKL